MATKADLINDAYSQLRISGITVNPTPGDIGIALSRLESMVAEWESREMCLDYAFEEQPDVNTESGVPAWAHYAVSTNLAIRLIPDFNKAVPQALAMQAMQSAANVAAKTATVNQVQYASRQPIGNRNNMRLPTFQRFYPQNVPAPTGCEVKRMFIDDINDYYETWDAYLQSGEDIASYTLSAETGLTVVSDSLSSPRVDYRINAVGYDPERPTIYPIVTITVTTTTGRVNTRIVQFEVKPRPN